QAIDAAGDPDPARLRQVAVDVGDVESFKEEVGGSGCDLKRDWCLWRYGELQLIERALCISLSILSVHSKEMLLQFRFPVQPKQLSADLVKAAKQELNNTPLRAERSQEAIVYVGNPDPQLSEEFLWECSIQAGHVGKFNALVHMNNLRLVSFVSYGCWLYFEELVDFLCEEDIGYVTKFSFHIMLAIKVLNMIKLHGKPIRVNKASQDKKIIDVGCLWKQLKQWLIFTLLPKAAH
ncbi:unnamed protein product, partial [Brassica rapa subsp. trilocularis]